MSGERRARAGLSVEPRKVGARRFESYAVDGEAVPAFDRETLFDTQIISDLRRMFTEAGFPVYPARPARGESVGSIAARYIGAKPNNRNPRDVRASLAWILAEWARAEYRLAQHVDRDDAAAAWREGVAMGRLAEWWVWRSEGHDAGAVSRQDQNKGLHEARKKSARGRGFAAENWQDDARGIADEIREAHPGLSISEIARRVLRRMKDEDATFNKSHPHVRFIISK